MVNNGSASLDVTTELPYYEWIYNFGITAGYWTSATKWKPVGIPKGVEPFQPYVTTPSPTFRIQAVPLNARAQGNVPCNHANRRSTDTASPPHLTVLRMRVCAVTGEVYEFRNVPLHMPGRGPADGVSTRRPPPAPPPAERRAAC